jgi:hypothetical protein
MTAPNPRSAPTPRSAPSVPGTPGEAQVQSFLLRTNVALSRRKTYGGTHPMVASTEAEALAELDRVFATRSSFTLGVAKTSLLLNGQPFTGSVNITKEVAGRLYRRGVGALTFHSGVDLAGLQSLTEWLSLDPIKAIDVEPPTIAGIITGRLAYDALMLAAADSAAEASLSALWGALAQIAADGTGRQYGFGTSRSADVSAAVGNDDAAFDVMVKEEAHVSDITEALQQLVAQPEFARRTAVALMHLAAQGAQAPPELRARIGQRLHAVIERLGDSSFAPIIKGLGQRAEQQDFMLQVVDVLPVLAISNWLQVAARATEQQLSHHLLRLMTKLSQHASGQRKGLTDANFREAAKDLVEGWVLGDPNPDEHVQLLDRIALIHEQTAAALARSPEQDAAGLTEGSRVVQMALEIGVVGDDALAAADAVIAGGGLTEFLSWLDAAGPSDTSRQLRARTMEPAAIKRVLHEDPVDAVSARMLLQRIDIGMTDTLLDALSTAQCRDARDLIIEKLKSFGEPLRDALIARLDGASWFFARNLLSLIHELLIGQKGNDDVGAMLSYVDHVNPQVRVEAVRMLLDIDAVREAVIRRGLLDTDGRVVEVVLLFVNHYLHAPHEGKKRSLSPSVAGHLIRFVDAGKHGDALLVSAMRSAGATGYALVRDWLLARVIQRSRILRRAVLAKPTLLTATALSVLQRNYASDPQVADALALGRSIKGDANWRIPTPYMGMPAIK